MRCWDEQIHHELACREYEDLIDCRLLPTIFDNLDNSARDYGTTPYDSKSIMHYAIPLRIFRPGAATTCAAPQNAGPSKDDLALVRELYPPSGAPPTGSGCADQIAAVSQVLGLDLNQKRALGEELTLRIAAGVKSKTFLNMKLDGGLGVQPPIAPFVGRDIDCTPTSLRGKASCSVSADGAALNIAIH
jgi:hypothetical protein